MHELLHPRLLHSGVHRPSEIPLGHGLHGGLGADVKIILTPPCMFCMENRALNNYTGRCQNDFNVQGYGGLHAGTVPRRAGCERLQKVRSVSDWPKRCKLAHAFLRESSCKRHEVGPTSGPTRRLPHLRGGRERVPRQTMTRAARGVRRGRGRARGRDGLLVGGMVGVQDQRDEAGGVRVGPGRQRRRRALASPESLDRRGNLPAYPCALKPLCVLSF